MFDAQSYGQAAPAAQVPAVVMPPVYVQNPFTGEYLLASIDGRAAKVHSQQAASFDSDYRAGGMR